MTCSTFSTSKNVVRPRRFIQYNDLVFEGTESINASPSETFTTKYHTTDYMFQNGALAKTNSQQVLLKDDKISLDLAIRTTDWSMEQIQAHQDFIKDNLLRPGKLWAIDTGGQLIWADCILDSYTPTYDWTLRDDGYILFQVAFTNPRAVWHKANGYTTWLMDYTSCNFVKMIASCYVNNTCPSFCMESNIVEGACKDCESDCCNLNDAHSLCELSEDIRTEFYDRCTSKWRIIHNCALGRETFGEEKLLGEARCDTCVDGAWADTFYADTVVHSKKVNITLQGKFKDPSILINDTKVDLEGEYDGYVTISSEGKVYYYQCVNDFTCGEAELVSNEKLTLCDNRWWFIQRGFNQIAVRGIESESFCVFIDYERITI